MNRKGCAIEATGINYTIYPQPSFNIFNKNQQSNSDHNSPRRVLREVSCHAKPWEVLAIVGPSGAGKSSLLEILAGKLTPQTASIYVNGRPVDKTRFKKISGYVTQRDTLFPLLTVEETLVFTAKLRLNLGQPELTSRVKLLIHELGLTHVANARVGDDRVRGISGGERRRVSIGVAVVHDPEVVILDEPTSGLDSNCAFQIIDMVKTMAETRGKTVVLSIHQPGFRIIKLFNSILLLANGTVLHQGSIDELNRSLRLNGLEPPLHVNVIEFAIDSIDIIQQQKNQKTSNLEENITPSTNKMIQGKFTLQQLFQQSKVIDLDHEQEEHNEQELIIRDGFANSRFCETIILTHRFWKNISRTKELFACRTLQMLVSGLILGSIFYNLDMDLLGAQERVGLFAFILTFLLSTTVEALPVFLQEKEILMKETSCGSYRVSSYAIANGLVYLPFLLILAILFATPLYWLVGLNPNVLAFSWFLLLIWLILYTANSVVVCFSALVPNFIVGNSVISGVMGSFFLFSGYFVSKQGMPKYWIFMHYISLFKYPFEGLLMNEFSGGEGKCLEYLFGKCLVSGEDVLRETGGFEEDGKWKNIVIMVCFILVYRFISYVILRFKCSQKGLKVVF
ncbi:putative ABC transporter, AAA+ ATPase domain, ABC-2 type transporter [Helianthus annuus]|nr:putative ABC transporter, AAA+ ATPase domain, ABC-2 type transporter [Helianthus annuus]KAJ0957455.1 putative pleiotropic drug resistance protein PDR/CDR [Helianthus annuus]